MDVYIRKYGVGAEGYPDLRQRQEELKDWVCAIPFQDGDVDMLCCPEDRTCRREGCVLNQTLCPECWVPICRTCVAGLLADNPRLPHSALANDLMIFYAPRELYTQEVTVMEMICSSVCITSMVCFSMEAKYGNMFGTTAHMQRHRVGARGNATYFPMSWQAILTELMKLDAEVARNVAPSLPRTGEDLKYVVQVLLKTNDEDKRDNLKHFIYQARVRRDVVVKLILSLKACGHRSYLHVSQEDVRSQARKLPIDGVPPAIIHCVPCDNTLDKIMVQKAATPVEGMRQGLE